MSISGILSSNFNQSHPVGAGPDWQQIQKLSQQLTSGSPSAAQSDFATLQKAFSQPATTAGSPSGIANPAAQAFNQLVTDLQSGNLSAAQKDISSVQQALQSLNGAGSGNRVHHSHHFSGSGGGNGDSTSQNGLLQDLNQLGQSLTAGSLSGAQQAYATLQQQLQQFALGGGALSTESPVSFDA